MQRYWYWSTCKNISNICVVVCRLQMTNPAQLCYIRHRKREVDMMPTMSSLVAFCYGRYRSLEMESYRDANLSSWALTHIFVMTIRSTASVKKVGIVTIIHFRSLIAKTFCAANDDQFRITLCSVPGSPAAIHRFYYHDYHLGTCMHEYFIFRRCRVHVAWDNHATLVTKCHFSWKNS